jgi:hypothetical protein
MTASKPKPVDLTELAKIHIAADQLGLNKHGDDSAYRDMLWSIARVRDMNRKAPDPLILVMLSRR